MASEQGLVADGDPKTSGLAGEGTPLSLGVPSDSTLSNSYPPGSCLMTTPELLIQHVVKTTTELGTALQKEVALDLSKDLGGVGRSNEAITAWRPKSAAGSAAQCGQLPAVRDISADHGMTAFCNAPSSSPGARVTGATQELAPHLAFDEFELCQADRAGANSSLPASISGASSVTASGVQGISYPATSVSERMLPREESGQQTDQPGCPASDLTPDRFSTVSFQCPTFPFASAGLLGGGEQRGEGGVRNSNSFLGESTGSAVDGDGAQRSLCESDGISLDSGRLRTESGVGRVHLEEGDEGGQASRPSGPGSGVMAPQVVTEQSSRCGSTVPGESSKAVNTLTRACPDGLIFGHGRPVEARERFQAPCGGLPVHGSRSPSCDGLREGADVDFKQESTPARAGSMTGQVCTEPPPHASGGDSSPAPERAVSAREIGVRRVVATEFSLAGQDNGRGSGTVNASPRKSREEAEVNDKGESQGVKDSGGSEPSATPSGSDAASSHTGDYRHGAVGETAAEGSFGGRQVSSPVRQFGRSAYESTEQQSPLLRMSTSFASFEKLPSISSQQDCEVSSAETEAVRQEGNAMETAEDGANEAFSGGAASSRLTSFASAGSTSEVALSSPSTSSIATRLGEGGSSSSGSCLSPVLISPLSVGEISPIPSPGTGPVTASWTLATVRLPPPVCAFSSFPFLSTGAAPPLRIPSSVSTSSSPAYSAQRQTDTGTVLASCDSPLPKLPSGKPTDGVLAVFCPRHPHHQHLHSLVGPPAQARARLSKSNSREHSPSPVNRSLFLAPAGKGESESGTVSSSEGVASSSPSGIFARLRLSQPSPASGVRSRLLPSDGSSPVDGSSACPPGNSLPSRQDSTPPLSASPVGGAVPRAAPSATGSWRSNSPCSSSPSGIERRAGALSSVRPRPPSKDRSDSLLPALATNGSLPAPTAGSSIFRRVRSLKQLQQDVTVVFSTWTHTLANWAAPWGAGPEEGGSIKAGQRAVVLGKLFWVRDTSDDDEFSADKSSVEGGRLEEGKRRQSSSSVPEHQAAPAKSEDEVCRQSSSYIGSRTRSFLWGMSRAGQQCEEPFGRGLQRRNSAGASARTGDRWRRSVAPAETSGDDNKPTPQAEDKEPGPAAEHVAGNASPTQRRSSASVGRASPKQAEGESCQDLAEKRALSARSGFLAMMTPNNIGGAGTLTGFLGRGRRAQAAPPPASSVSEADASDDQKSGEPSSSPGSGTEDSRRFPPVSAQLTKECNNADQGGKGRRRGRKASSTRRLHREALPLTLPGGEPWPRWRVGCVASDAAYVQQQLIAAVRSIARFTYRSGFAPMYRCCGEKKKRAGGGADREWIAINSDVGWGCTVRAAQMLLLQALKRHFLDAGEEPADFAEKGMARRRRSGCKPTTKASLLRKEHEQERAVETSEEEAGQRADRESGPGESPLIEEERISGGDGGKNGAVDTGLCTLSESPTTTAASPLPSASPSPPVPLQSKLLPSASNSACSSIPFLSLSQPVHSSEDTGDRVNKTCHDTPADTTAASSSARSAKVQQVAVCRTPSAMSSPQSVEELLQWFLDVPSPPADYPFSIFSFIRAAGGGIGWARQLYGELGLEEELFCAGAKGRRAKALSAIREEHRDEKETPCSCASGDTPAKEEEEEASTLSCGSVISTFSSGARTIGSGHTFGDGPTNVAGPQSLYGSPGSSFLSSTKQAEEQDGSTARQGGDGGGCVTQFASRFERCFHVGGGTGEEDEDENPLERRGLGKFAGEWFGPATASTAVKLLVESMPQTKDTLFVYVSSDGLLYPQDILGQCLEPLPSAFSGQQQNGSDGSVPYGEEERAGASSAESCVCCPCCCASARRESGGAAEQGVASHFRSDEFSCGSGRVGYLSPAAVQEGVPAGSCEDEGQRASISNKRRIPEGDATHSSYSKRASASVTNREHAQSRAHVVSRVREVPSSPGPDSLSGSSRNGNGGSVASDANNFVTGNAAEEEDWEEIPFCSSRSPRLPAAGPLSGGRGSTGSGRGSVCDSSADSSTSSSSVHHRGGERTGSRCSHRRERRWNAATGRTSSRFGREPVEGGGKGAGGRPLTQSSRGGLDAADSRPRRGRRLSKVDVENHEKEQTAPQSGAEEQDDTGTSQVVACVQKSPAVETFEAVEDIVLAGAAPSRPAELSSAAETATTNCDSPGASSRGQEVEGLPHPGSPRVIADDSTSALPSGGGGGGLDPSAYMMLSSPKGPRPLAYTVASDSTGAGRGCSSAPSSPRCSSQFSGSPHERSSTRSGDPKTTSSVTSWSAGVVRHGGARRRGGAAGAGTGEFLAGRDKGEAATGRGGGGNGFANCLENVDVQRGVDGCQTEGPPSAGPEAEVAFSSLSCAVATEGITSPTSRRLVDWSGDGEGRTRRNTSESHERVAEVLQHGAKRADCPGHFQSPGIEVKDGGADEGRGLSLVFKPLQGGELSEVMIDGSGCREGDDSSAALSEVLPSLQHENLLSPGSEEAAASGARLGRRLKQLEGSRSALAQAGPDVKWTLMESRNAVGDEAAVAKDAGVRDKSCQPFEASRTSSAPPTCFSCHSHDLSLSVARRHPMRCPLTTTLAVRYIPPFSLSPSCPVDSLQGESLAATRRGRDDGEAVPSVPSPSPPCSGRCLDLDFSDDNTPPTVNSANLSPICKEESASDPRSSPSPEEPGLSPEGSGLLYPSPGHPASAARRCTPLSSSSPPVPRLRALPNCMVCVSSVSPSGARSGRRSGLLSSSRSRHQGAGTGAVETSGRGCESGGGGGGTTSGGGSPSPSLSASLPLNTSRSEGSAAPSDGSATGRWCSVEALLPGPDEDLLLASSVLVSHRNTQRSYSPSYSPALGTTRRSFGGGGIRGSARERVTPSVGRGEEGGEREKEEEEGELMERQGEGRSAEYTGVHEHANEEASVFDDAAERGLANEERGTSRLGQESLARPASHDGASASEGGDDDEGENGWIPFLPFVPPSSCPSSRGGRFEEGTSSNRSESRVRPTRDVGTSSRRGESHPSFSYKKAVERSRVSSNKGGGEWCECREGGLFELSARSARGGSESARATPGTSQSTSSRTATNQGENQEVMESDEGRQRGTGRGGDAVEANPEVGGPSVETSDDRESGVAESRGMTSGDRESRCSVAQRKPSLPAQEYSYGGAGRDGEDRDLKKEDAQRLDGSSSSDFAPSSSEDEGYSGNCQAEGENRRWRKGCLLLFPLTLCSGEKINPVYVPSLLAYLELPWSLGMVAGRGQQAFYVVGTQEKALLYLDPHSGIQPPALELPSATPSFFAGSCWKLSDISALNPSLSIAFFVRSTRQLKDLTSALRHIEKSDQYAMLQVVDDSRGRPRDCYAFSEDDEGDHLLLEEPEEKVEEEVEVYDEESRSEEGVSGEGAEQMSSCSKDTSMEATVEKELLGTQSTSSPRLTPSLAGSGSEKNHREQDRALKAPVRQEPTVLAQGEEGEGEVNGAERSGEALEQDSHGCKGRRQSDGRMAESDSVTSNRRLGLGGEPCSDGGPETKESTSAESQAL